MTFILQPAVALSNSLRFKAKFLLLACMFYIPLIACVIWIVNDQLALLKQYESELQGFEQIESVIVLEKAIAQTRVEPNKSASIAGKIKQLQQNLSDSHHFTQLTPQTTALLKFWQSQQNNLSVENFPAYQNLYSQTLSLRENLAALSGLTRESDVIAFYLMEAGEQHLPSLLEYLARYKDLTADIIEQGFSAESYTSIVALNNRLSEIISKFTKTNEQLARVSADNISTHVQQARSLIKSITEYQQVVNSQVIEPDDISLSISESKRQSNEQMRLLEKYKKATNVLLLTRITAMQSSSNQSLWLLSVVILIVTVASSYLSLAIYQSLRRNVYHINQAAERLGNGDFTEILSVQAKDELGDIARSFALMQSKIQQLLTSFNQDVGELRNASSNIYHLTDDMQKNIATQQQEIHRVADSISQVSDSVKTIADNTNGAQQLTELASDNVSQGQTIVKDTGETINDISQEVNISAVVINELAENSSEIASFVNVIREIADQTNLLALNAAIEAARAGEQGRGFAVVADEVRTLASRTQDSTTEIQRIIEKLQKGAADSVIAMNKGVEKAKLGVEKTQQVQHAFSEVTGNVENIVNATSEISVAVTQQREMVSDIDENTTNIAQGADQVLHAANQAAESGQNLSALADHLSVQLEQFTLRK